MNSPFANSVSSRQVSEDVMRPNISLLFQVIKVVRRLDGCTPRQATLFAIIVNRDGRTPLKVNLSRKVASEKAERISVSPRLLIDSQ